MADEIKLNKAALLKEIDAGWQELTTYLNGLSNADFVTNTDAAGWTVKDHVMHIACWEDGVLAVMEGGNRYQRMGLDKATWESHDYDRINGLLQQMHQDKPLDSVRQHLNDVHAGFVDAIDALSEDELYKPYGEYQPEYAEIQDPVIRWLIANSYEHYREHIPWMAAIVADE